MAIRLAVFDFDRTLTAKHVFAGLSGKPESGFQVPPPHVRTEYGQLLKLAELDANPAFTSQGGFAALAVGGAERAKMLRCMLDELRRSGIECIICTRGLVGPTKRILEQVGILDCFTAVFGNVGAALGSMPQEAQLAANGPGILGDNARFLGTPAESGWDSKRSLIARCLQERRLRPEEAVFIDDDPGEVQSVQGVCPTIQVIGLVGMGQREIAMLRQLIEASRGRGAAAPQAALQAAPQAAPQAVNGQTAGGLAAAAQVGVMSGSLTGRLSASAPTMSYTPGVPYAASLGSVGTISRGQSLTCSAQPPSTLSAQGVTATTAIGQQPSYTGMQSGSVEVPTTLADDAVKMPLASQRVLGGWSTAGSLQASSRSLRAQSRSRGEGESFSAPVWPPPQGTALSIAAAAANAATVVGSATATMAAPAPKVVPAPTPAVPPAPTPAVPPPPALLPAVAAPAAAPAVVTGSSVAATAAAAIGSSAGGSFSATAAATQLSQRLAKGKPPPPPPPQLMQLQHRVSNIALDSYVPSAGTQRPGRKLQDPQLEAMRSRGRSPSASRKAQVIPAPLLGTRPSSVPPQHHQALGATPHQLPQQAPPPSAFMIVSSVPTPKSPVVRGRTGPPRFAIPSALQSVAAPTALLASEDESRRSPRPAARALKSEDLEAKAAEIELSLAKELDAQVAGIEVQLAEALRLQSADEELDTGALEDLLVRVDALQYLNEDMWRRQAEKERDILGDGVTGNKMLKASHIAVAKSDSHLPTMELPGDDGSLAAVAAAAVVPATAAEACGPNARRGWLLHELRRLRQLVVDRGSVEAEMTDEQLQVLVEALCDGVERPATKVLPSNHRERKQHRHASQHHLDTNKPRRRHGSGHWAEVPVPHKFTRVGAGGAK